jgi:hypothetical protein
MVRCGLACVFALTPVLAGDVSYVVLNRQEAGNLVRVSSDGSSFQQIANIANGIALALDRKGDYLVVTNTPGHVANSSLLRVTRSGTVSKIIDAPRESGWVAVTVDGTGKILLADNRTHSIWRVSPDGSDLARICSYPVANPHRREDAGILSEGDGPLIISLDVGPDSLFRLDPGSLTASQMRGAIVSGGHIIADADGSYLVTNNRRRAILRLTAAGGIEQFASIPGFNLTGIVRNPQTLEVVVTLNFSNALMRVSPDGKIVELLAGPPYLSRPISVVADTGFSDAATRLPVARKLGLPCLIIGSLSLDGIGTSNRVFGETAMQASQDRALPSAEAPLLLFWVERQAILPQSSPR